MTKPLFSILIWCVAVAISPTAFARGGMGGGMMGGGSVGLGGSLGSGSGTGLPGILGSDGKYYNNFKPTGLVPEFPNNLGCGTVLASFGSPSTSDGIDLNIPSGGHLLSMADGEVIALGTGSAKEGNYLWLRFAPAATDQMFWTFVKYQHLPAIPALEIGSHISSGEIIPFSDAMEIAKSQGNDARSAATVYISTSYGPSPEFRLGGRWQSVVKATGGKLGDPLILFTHNIGMPEAANELPLEKRHVVIAVAGTDHKIFPPSSKIVWPVTCQQ